MTNQSILKLLFLSLTIAFCTQSLSAQQGYQILQKANDRDLYHNCSSPLSNGGYYVVSHYFVRNLADTIPDSIGIHVSKNDFKGEITWAKEYHLQADDVDFEKYQKGIECHTSEEDTLHLIVADLEAQETSSAKIYFQIEPNVGEIVNQFRLEDLSAEEEILTNLNCELFEDHNDQLYYMGTHNSDDVVGVHLERLVENNVPLSRSYFATDTLGEQIDLSLGAGIAMDTGFVFSAMLGDSDERTAAMVQLDSLGVPVFASSYMLENSLETNLQFISMAALPDTTYVHLGILTNVMNQSEVSTIVKTDSIGRVMWAKRLEAGQIISQAQEILLTNSSELVVIGKYKDFGTTVGDFALFMDQAGNVLRETSYESEVSAWTDEMNSQDFDAMDVSPIIYSEMLTVPNLLITSQGQMEGGEWVPMIIKTDLLGVTLCNNQSTTHTLADYELLRDTLLIDQGQFVDRASSDFFALDYNDYNLATSSVENMMLCMNDVPKDTFFDGTIMGVDSMFVSYVWSQDGMPTGDTTAIINFNVPNADKDIMYTVVATVNKEVCFTLCDTATVMFFPEPQAVIERRYDCSADPSQKWILTVSNPNGAITEVEWTNSMGVVIGTDLSIAVPETPGAVFQVTITDACGLTATTQSDPIPPLPVASAGVNTSLLCETPPILILFAEFSPLYSTAPLQYLWTVNGNIVSTEASFEITEADLTGDPTTFTVVVTDACGNVDDATIEISPEDFLLPESALEIVGLGLSNASPCPYELEAVFVDGVNNQFIPTYNWSPNPTGETGNVLAVTEPGIYTINVTDACGRPLTASFEVTAADLDSPPPSVMIDNEGLNPCDYFLVGRGIAGERDGQTFAIDENLSGWTGPNGAVTGDGNSVSGERIRVDQPGTYTYMVVDACEKDASMSITITESDLDVADPTVSISNGGLNSQCYVNLLAEGISAPQLDAGSYLWDNGDVGPASTALSPGVYTVTYTDECGQTVTAEITLTETDFTETAPPDVSIVSSAVTDDCARTLTAEINNTVTVTGYQWSNGSASSSIEVTGMEAGTYSVTVTGCGTSSEAEFVASNSEIVFPDIFFPNSTAHDGVNATFGPEVTCPDFTNYKLEIYNRWGKRVFEADRFEDRWSGSLDNQGSRLEEDVYMWQCTYTSAAGDQLMKGSVTSVPR